MSDSWYVYYGDRRGPRVHLGRCLDCRNGKGKQPHKEHLWSEAFPSRKAAEAWIQEREYGKPILCGNCERLLAKETE